MVEPRQLYTSPFFSRDYFSNVMLPIGVEAGRRTASQFVPFTQHDDLLLIFVSSGRGRIIINSREYKVERGHLFCLNPFHFPMLIPEKDSPLVLWECRFTVGASLYLGACPYNPVKSLDMPYSPSAAIVPEHISVKIENIMSEIESVGNNPNADSSLCFMLLIRLFGYLYKHSRPPLALPDYPWDKQERAEASGAKKAPEIST